MQQLTIVETEFSTIDSEYPEFIKSGGELTLKFEDRLENQVEVYFGEVIAFKWQECFSLFKNEEEHKCYIVENSEWVNSHIKQNLIDGSDGYIHYKFNFKGLGQLEVISLGYLTKT